METFVKALHVCISLVFFQLLQFSPKKRNKTINWKLLHTSFFSLFFCFLSPIHLRREVQSTRRRKTKLKKPKTTLSSWRWITYFRIDRHVVWCCLCGSPAMSCTCRGLVSHSLYGVYPSPFLLFHPWFRPNLSSTSNET